MYCFTVKIINKTDMVSNHQIWNGKNVVVDLITVRTFAHGHAWNTSMDYKFLGAHGPDYIG